MGREKRSESILTVCSDGENKYARRLPWFHGLLDWLDEMLLKDGRGW